MVAGSFIRRCVRREIKHRRGGGSEGAGCAVGSRTATGDVQFRLAALDIDVIEAEETQSRLTRHQLNVAAADLSLSPRPHSWLA